MVVGAGAGAFLSDADPTSPQVSQDHLPPPSTPAPRYVEPTTSGQPMRGISIMCGEGAEEQSDKCSKGTE